MSFFHASLGKFTFLLALVLTKKFILSGLSGQEFQGYAVFQPEGHNNKDGNWNNISYENNNNNQDSWNKSRPETKRKNSIKNSNCSNYIYMVEGCENQAFYKSTDKINSLETHETLEEGMVHANLAEEERKPDSDELTPTGFAKEESSPVADRVFYDGFSNEKTNPASKLVSAYLAKEEATPAIPVVERTYNLKRDETKQDVNTKTHAAASNLAKEFERLAETILQRAVYDIIEFQKQVTVSISATERNIRKSTSDTKETDPALEVRQQVRESKARKLTWTMTETELFEKDKLLVEAGEQATVSNLNRRLLLDETPSTEVDQELIAQLRGKRSAQSAHKLTFCNEVLQTKTRWLETTNNNVKENTFAPDSVTLAERNARVEIDMENDNEKKIQEKIPWETDIRKDCDLLYNIKHSVVERAEELQARIRSAGKPETMNLSETANIRYDTSGSMKSLCSSENTSVVETVRHLETLQGSERTSESEEIDRSDSGSDFETASESEMSRRSEVSGKLEASSSVGTDRRSKEMEKVRKRKDKRKVRGKEKNDGMGNIIHGRRTRKDTAEAPYIRKEHQGLVAFTLDKPSLSLVLFCLRIYATIACKHFKSLPKDL